MRAASAARFSNGWSLLYANSLDLTIGELRKADGKRMTAVTAVELAPPQKRAEMR